MTKAKDKASEMNWCESPGEEVHAKALSPNGVWAAIPFEEIDWQESLKNIGRLNKSIHEETVEGFQAAVEQGHVFPGGVVYRPDARKLGIIYSGMNRAETARRSGSKSFFAFIMVDVAQPAELRLLAAVLNAHHGRATSMTERVAQAIDLLTLGLSRSNVAMQLGIPLKRLAEGEKAERIRVAAQARGVNLATVPQAHLLALGHFEDQPLVLAAVAEAAAKTCTNVEEVRELVATVKQQPTENAKVRFCAEALRKRVIPQPKPGDRYPGMSPIQRFSKALQSVSRILDEHATLESMARGCKDVDKEAMRTLMLHTALKLQEAARTKRGGAA